MNPTSAVAKAQTSAKYPWHDAKGDQFDVLTDIYQQNTNIAIWQRSVPATLIEAGESILATNSGLELSLIVTPEEANAAVTKALGAMPMATVLSEDIAQLVDMFCCLFDLRRAGLRLTALDRAMCPRFHVDKVSCRLITTYQGVATEWLPHHAADRSKLGLGNQANQMRNLGYLRVPATSNSYAEGMLRCSRASLGREIKGRDLFIAHPSCWTQHVDCC